VSKKRALLFENLFMVLHMVHEVFYWNAKLSFQNGSQDEVSAPNETVDGWLK